MSRVVLFQLLNHGFVRHKYHLSCSTCFAYHACEFIVLTFCGATLVLNLLSSSCDS